MKITGHSAESIFDSIRDGIGKGRLPAGSVLPPVRELAEQLGVNRNTVAAAYKRLDAAGLADLTVWADFPSVVAAAREAGAKAGPILTQAQFLLALGILDRAEALAARQPEKTEQIGRQLDRLLGEAQMGSLFKVACLCSPDLSPPLFEDAT